VTLSYLAERRTHDGKEYIVVDETWYKGTTPQAVIDVLESVRRGGGRIHLHHGYTTQADADAAGLGGVVGRDWLEEFDTEGSVGRSCGKIKAPLLIKRSRASGGHAILTDCIVKITTAGKRRRTLYQHANYHHGKLTLHPCRMTLQSKQGEKTLLAEAHIDGVAHARFYTMEKAIAWAAMMNLPIS
jgi:hypothetical protein